MMSLGPRSLRQAVFTRLPMIFAESLEKCPKSIGSKETAKPVLTRKQDTMPLASLMVGRSLLLIVLHMMRYRTSR